MGTNWRGVFKLIEECGELQQCLGKLCVYTSGEHPDGENWRVKLVEELADVEAAIQYLIDSNLSTEEAAAIEKRRIQKLVKFCRWGLSGV